MSDGAKDIAKIGIFARIRRSLHFRYRRFRHRLLGATDTHWARFVMDRETARFVSGLSVQSMSALEISGTRWQNAGFQSYESVNYPDYDICEKPYRVEAFDAVFAEQVFEHVLWPFRAVRHVFQMLRPNGVFVITTPFMLKVHHIPIDCCRWTELGLKHLLAEGGFPLARIQTGSWGNRRCVVGNFDEWQNYIPLLHSLKNEPDFPVVVWAFARKDP